MAIFAEARLLSISSRLLKNKSIRNITLVAAGTAGAQLINVAFTPLITRLYGPEAFGILGTFLAILAILTPLAALSYPIAIVLPKNDKDAARLGRASVWIAVVTSLLTVLIILLFKTQLVQLFDLQTVEPYLLLLPLAMFFTALAAVASNWILRLKLYKVSARVAVLQSLGTNLAKVGAGLLNPLAAVLIVVASVAIFFHGAMLWLGIRRQPRIADPAAAEAGEGASSTRELLSRHKDFPFFRTPQIVINSIGQSLPVLMIAGLFGPAAAGLYALPKAVMGMPTMLIGRSVSDVFYPQFVENVRDGKNAHSILLQACTPLLALGILVYAPVVILGPWLFGFIFGSEWYAAGEYARWMSFWFIAILASRPIIAAIPVLSLQGVFLLFEIGALMLRALAIYAGYTLTSSALGAVAAFSLMNVLVFVLLTLLVLRRAAKLKSPG
ncbi:MAG: oligosaccharide flippase family protein [Cellvibrionaceae bacterium]|nr:oligosaccharide flippase family protein [Cellvibrionaceae bacterium]